MFYKDVNKYRQKERGRKRLLESNPALRIFADVEWNEHISDINRGASVNRLNVYFSADKGISPIVPIGSSDWTNIRTEYIGEKIISCKINNIDRGVAAYSRIAH